MAPLLSTSQVAWVTLTLFARVHSCAVGCPDSIVMFEPLDWPSLVKIVELQVAALANRLKNQDVALRITPAASSLILNTAYDPAFGARPIRCVRLEDVLFLWRYVHVALVCALAAAGVVRMARCVNP